MMWPRAQDHFKERCAHPGCGQTRVDHLVSALIDHAYVPESKRVATNFRPDGTYDDKFGDRRDVCTGEPRAWICPVCGPECKGGAHRNAMIEDGVPSARP